MANDTIEPKAARSPINRTIGWIAAVLICLPVLYFLSIGPAIRLVDRGTFNQSVVKSFYLPVLILADRSETFNRFLDWYVTDIWHCDP